MAQSILVIEKAEAVATILRRDLHARDYAISSASQRRALSRVQKLRPDLIILDTQSIPYDRAADICQALLNTTHTPIIALLHGTWPKEELEGASYLRMPPKAEEMSSRIDAVLEARRAAEELAGDKNPARDVSLGGLQLDLTERTLTRKAHQVHLTPKETSLLFAFVTHPGLVLTRGWLMREIWETDYTGDTRTLYVHIRWLRQKIEEDPATPRLLKTIRGVGYLFDGSP